MVEAIIEQRHKNTGRNDDCPCGSGKKYKKCHLAQDEEALRAERTRLAAEAAEKAKAEQAKAEAEGKADEAAPREAAPEPKIKPKEPAAKAAPKMPVGGAPKPVSAPRKMV